MTILLAFPAGWIPKAHTTVAFTAFGVALFAGWASGLWKELCTNSVARWPVEWFPSVSATIGDHPPPRAPFQILIALCVTPRFLLLLVQWLVHRYPSSRAGDEPFSRSEASAANDSKTTVFPTSRSSESVRAKNAESSRDRAQVDQLDKVLRQEVGSTTLVDIELFIGIARTFCCGGWVYITSRDHHDIHDLFMILRIPFFGFLTMIPPLIWFYYQHSVVRTPGAYTYYSIFEWSLILWDVGFDAIAVEELGNLQIAIIDTSSPSTAEPMSTSTKGEPASFFLAQPASLRSVSERDEVDWTATSTVTSTPGRLALAWASDVYWAVCFWTIFTSLGFQLFYWSVWKLVLGLGLVITLLIKYMSGSVNPLWAIAHAPSGGWNKPGLLLAVLSLAEYAHRPVDLHPAPPINHDSSKKEGSALSTRPRKWQQRCLSVGLGALIHLLQTFVTDAGTIISWTWTGYPVKGPTLHPFAGPVIASAALGLCCTSARLAPVMTAMGTAGAIVLYRYPNWTGYIGGLALIAFLTSVLPVYLRSASACHPAPTFGYALLTKILLDVASVITAAYAFVPMGWLLRERTDLVIGFCLLATVGGWLVAGSLALPQGSAIPLRSQRRITALRRYTLMSAAVLSAVSMACAYGKMPTAAPTPYYPDHKIFSGGIWTVHFGVDKEGRDSQRRMMDLIRDMQVDVLGLLETDLHRFVYGNRDLTRVISEELGYYVDLGPGPNKHTWGAALLSKFPILNSTHHLLPSPHGELAPAIHATLDVHGTKVNVMVSHNGQEEDLLDRTLQTTEIARLLRETEDTPTVFLGYLVTRAGDLRPWPYQILIEDGRMYDIEIADRWRWCEYIAFRGLWRIGYARVHESDISDTELQVGKFMLPKADHPVLYATNEELYWHVGEANIPEPWHMPAMFRGEGTRGHRYRVWDGPLYYLPPARSGLRDYGWGWSTEQ
ncbi:hypothetical protein IAU60_004602 [Kwoniella sp. DSM 27419]